jgi:hypothetical protein
MNNKQQGVFTMKSNFKTFAKALGAIAVAVVLTACATQTLEQQIAVKEPGSWDFITKNSRGVEYVRIYDSPEKVGWFKYEYGQKSPCNQGFQQVTKTTSAGLVQYSNVDTKSFACGEKIAYVFRVDQNDQPFEGWVQAIPATEKRTFIDLPSYGRWIEKNNIVPKFSLIK